MPPPHEGSRTGVQERASGGERRRAGGARGATLRGGAMARVSTPDFWEDVYARGGDGWELGRPAPPLVDILDTMPPPRGRVAVPGCGRGHDARLLATRGYDVMGFDFAPAALAQARA